ncbi:hypothetical protein GUITHDRAFT_103430 [Guillardia theta CCMP2712]|uniref:BRCT domain-containing protein n=1 Tax=Guillardia theta (strain CCMP2712) TaxID=905079 RepID=L1JQY5_GUITC|nr:hypothetical protein GUITHDRAFT_103430 [Guillardia theta CCMP2712]EKX50842.1 hypothetical protein GUITHDRAFT_103430 [Guillardia theta CCMP2712]|eukprot:XP_005837822.1 hypothetical protein GUITHDRAFT_103430 [Guillardia theta CCMP2712]
MGAQYRQDVTTDTTHVVCKFDGTPKIAQARQQGCFIVRTDWIQACHHEQKRLPEDDFLLHKQDQNPPASKRPRTDVQSHGKNVDSSQKLPASVELPGSWMQAEVALLGKDQVDEETSKMVDGDIKRFRDYLASQVKDNQDKETIARKGLLEAFVYAKECHEQHGDLKSFQDEWIGPIPLALQRLLEVKDLMQDHGSP